MDKFQLMIIFLSLFSISINIMVLLHIGKLIKGTIKIVDVINSLNRVISSNDAMDKMHETIATLNKAVENNGTDTRIID